MRKSYRWSVGMVVSIVLGLCCLAAGRPADEQIMQALEKLQGTWRCTKLVKAGQEAPLEMVGRVTFTFKADQVINSINEDDPATIKVDPSQTPAAIDFINKAAKVDVGIYAIEGDTLKFCMSTAESKKPRPTKFESTSENDAMLGVFVRQR